MKRLIFTSWLMMISMSLLIAQTKYTSTNTNIRMDGTSTMHDWHMVSEKGVSQVNFNFDGSSLTGMPSLNFSVAVESLKSSTKGLNKNAYKALDAEKYPTISFVSNYANIRASGSNAYVVSAKGKLTISGVSKDIWVAAVCKVNPDTQKIETSGSLKLKMSEYNVEAPSFMFGAMKTGDEVTIKFNTTLSK